MSITQYDHFVGEIWGDYAGGWSDALERSFSVPAGSRILLIEMMTIAGDQSATAYGLLDNHSYDDLQRMYAETGNISVIKLGEIKTELHHHDLNPPAPPADARALETVLAYCFKRLQIDFYDRHIPKGATFIKLEQDYEDEE